MAGHDDDVSTPNLRSFRWLGLPSWLLLLVVLLPLIAGSRTFFYRDILNTHYPLKAAQAQLVEDGAWPAPLLDPFRGGGQPLLGNPNAVPFYPTNFLYRVADPLWALNAHLWLHWLLAPFAGYWLGRAWRLGRSGAWACGVVWATGGYAMSLLNLYNMVALAALAPATVAAYLSLARSARAWPGVRLAMAAVLTGLTFLGGDPASAALVYLLAGAAYLTVVLGPERSESASLKTAIGRPAFAAGLGLLLAAPVLVEMLRVLPTSYRGLWHYETQSVLAQSWHPLTLLDWLVPGFFGRLDLSFWGGGLFGGNPPFFSSLFPGWLALALAAAAGFHVNRRHLWAWGSVGGGVFVALGGHNPLLARFAEWTEFGLLRYPVKAWLAVAIGLSLLAGIGFERLWRSGARRSVATATLLAAFVATLWTRTQFDADSALTRFAINASGGRLMGPALDAELARWAGISTISLLCLAAALGLVLGSKWRPADFLSLLLPLFAVTQLVTLSNLLVTDDTAPYRAPSPVAAHLAAGPHVDLVHGGFDGQFGGGATRPADPSLERLSRSLFAELFHGAGVARSFHYPFVRSPEGLDSFYAVAFAKALPRLDDAGRLRLLKAAGVEYLLLDRPLGPGARAGAEQVAVLPDEAGGGFRVFRLHGGADEVALVGGVRRADSMTAARDALLDASFDPRREVILPGNGPDTGADLAEGNLEVVRNQTERLELVTSTDADAHLVVQRAWLPIWRATIDGEPVEIEIANGWQMAVAIPSGRHEVTLFVDRGPGRWALGAFFVALASLVWLVIRPPRRATQTSGV